MFELFPRRTLTSSQTTPHNAVGSFSPKCQYAAFSGAPSVDSGASSVQLLVAFCRIRHLAQSLREDRVTPQPIIWTCSTTGGSARPRSSNVPPATIHREPVVLVRRRSMQRARWDSPMRSMPQREARLNHRLSPNAPTRARAPPASRSTATCSHNARRYTQNTHGSSPSRNEGR